VELLKEIAPRTVRMALLFNPGTPPPLEVYMPSIQAAASSFAIQAIAAPVHASDEIEGIIAAQAGDPGGGLIVMPNAFNVVNRERIIALAARYGVPAIYFNRFFTDSGGLISYGADRPEQVARRHVTSTASSRVPSRPTCQSSSQPNSSSSSTQRQQRSLVSTYLCISSGAPTR
jgi:ABC-type uncharacterized transport system substrate-binding protein